MRISKLHLMLMDCYCNENYTVKELKRIVGNEENKIRNSINELLYFFKVKEIYELRELQKNDINWRLNLKQKLIISKEDRKKYILLKFIKEDIINLSDISKELDVTRRVISMDLESLKDEIKKFGLVIKSLNSKGIELNGAEELKKELFVINLLKLFIEKDYLPIIFDNFFREFSEVIDNKIEYFVGNMIDKGEVLKQTYIHLNIEIYLYVGLIRDKNQLGIQNLKYELKKINQICIQNKKNNLIKSYKVDFYRVDHLIDYIEKNINLKIKRDDEVYLIIYSRLKIIDFKKENKLKEIYLINKNFEVSYKKFFDFVIEIIEKYFEEKIDSLDKISFFLLFNKFITFKNFIDDKLIGKTIILHNFFQRQLIDLYLEDIEKKIKMNIDDVISIYALKKYLKENKLKRIILLENVKLEEMDLNYEHIEIIKISFPISEIDCVKF